MLTRERGLASRSRGIAADRLAVCASPSAFILSAKPAGSSHCIQHTESSCPYHTLDARRPGKKRRSSSPTRGFWYSDAKSPVRPGVRVWVAQRCVRGWLGGVCAGTRGLGSRSARTEASKVRGAEALGFEGGGQRRMF